MGAFFMGKEIRGLIVHQSVGWAMLVFFISWWFKNILTI
jgi:hypothetical protein